MLAKSLSTLRDDTDSERVKCRRFIFLLVILITIRFFLHNFSSLLIKKVFLAKRTSSATKTVRESCNLVW